MVGWIRSGLARKMVAILLVAIVVVLGVYGFTLNRQVNLFFEQQVREKLQGDAAQISKELDLFMNRYLTIVEQMATNQDFVDYMSQVRTREMKREHPLARSASSIGRY